MRHLLSAAFACLMGASQARADDAELTLDQLPEAASRAIRQWDLDVEVLHIRKETEGDKECYVVTLVTRGRRGEYYVSLSGMMARRQEPRPLKDHMLNAMIILGVGVLIASFARWIGLAGTTGKSLVQGWCLAWCGVAVLFILLVASVSTVPREKDWLMIAVAVALWSGAAACFLEVLRLSVPVLGGRRVECRRWLLGNFVLGAGLLLLSYPVESLRVERVNEHYRTLAMKPKAP